ncbi:MAG: hypothetical protein GXN98_03325 [Euryarchaeota archaeon]|nr:hypothetical protein [Euryarchaeota archaeon]
MSDEMLYLMVNREKLEKEQGGKYVALYKDRVIAAGKTVHEVYEKVKKINVKNPLIVYIPRKGEEALLI